MENTLIPIIIALIAALPGIWAMNSQRRMTDANTSSAQATATDVLTDAALDIVKELKEQIDALRFEANEAKAVTKLSSGKIDQLEKHVSALEGQDQYNQREIKQLRREVEGLRMRVKQYRQGIEVLINQLKRLKQEPDFTLMPGDD